MQKTSIYKKIKCYININLKPFSCFFIIRRADIRRIIFEKSVWVKNILNASKTVISFLSAILIFYT